MLWNDKGRRAIVQQLDRIRDAESEYGKGSPEVKAERAKFKVMERNPNYQAK